MSLSAALQAALNSLLAHQTALAVASHNTANAQNPNYSRQVARLKASVPIPAPNLHEGMRLGQLGTGVSIMEISRQYDALLTTALRLSEGRVGYHETLLEGLERIEAFFDEPSENGLSAALTNFFEAWRDLSANPENAGVRVLVLERSQTLLARFQTLQRQLTREQSFAASQIQQEGERLNRLLEQLARLNEQITAVKASGMQPNDLMDERDAILQQISQLLTVQIAEQPTGAVVVMAGGHELVNAARFRPVRLTLDSSGMPVLVLDDTGDPLPLGEGMLAALQEFSRKVVQSLRDRLQSLLNALAQAVNERHQAGYGLDGSTGRPFFVLIGGEWQVNPELFANPEGIAASATGAPGDGQVAVSIARLTESALTDLNGQSVSDFYRNLISNFAARINSTRSTHAAFNEVHRFLLDRRDAVSGVSLDEEMVDLMRFQQAYIAAARVVQTVDNMVAELLARL